MKVKTIDVNNFKSIWGLMLGILSCHMTRPMRPDQDDGGSMFILKMGPDIQDRRRKVVYQGEMTQPRTCRWRLKAHKVEDRQGFSLLEEQGELETYRVTNRKVTRTLVSLGSRPVYKGESLRPIDGIYNQSRARSGDTKPL